MKQPCDLWPLLPGTLITLDRVDNVALYKAPGPVWHGHNLDQMPQTGLVKPGEVGTVLTCAYTRYNSVVDHDDGYWETLVLFGDRLGWRETSKFRVVT